LTSLDRDLRSDAPEDRSRDPVRNAGSGADVEQGTPRRAAADRPALRRCIAVAPQTFAAEHWGRTPLLSRAGTLPASFADLFDLAAVDELVSRRGLRTPFLRIAKDGVVVDPARYTGPGGAGAEVADQVLDDRVLALFADGATVVLQALHRTWPPLVAFAGQLAGDLGHPVQVNAYVTPPSSQGFSAHYDVHDVFVLQVAGQKRWKVHPPVHPDPLRSQQWTDRKAAVAEAASREPALDLVLRPGDALYLPRGWLHSALALGEVSAHLTVGMQPVTRAALVDALAALVLDDPALRQSLPLGVDVADPDALAEDLHATVEALVARLQSVDPAAVAGRLARTADAATRPAPLRPLAQAALAAELTPQTVIALRPQLRVRLRARAERVELVLPGRTLTLPALTEAALRQVLAAEPVAVADLPGLDPDDAVVLVRRLLREAVVVPAEPR